MNKEYAVNIVNVSKKFLLPHEKQSSIKGIFTSFFKAKGMSSEQLALDKINLKIHKGEFFGIVGRNGSGKSTLLKIIAGIYQPTNGCVKVNGKLVPFIELGVGFNPELTGRENVFLNGAILGFTHKEIENNYDNIVKFAELEEHMDVKLKNYSSGMQVRLAFACATRASADILLIDEVLAVGDADFQRKCFEYFKKLKKEGTTVIFITHDMSAVKEYCDRGVLIDDGKVQLSGSTEKITELYTKLFNDIAIDEDTNKLDPKQRWGNKDIFITSKPKINIQKESISVTVPLKNNNGVRKPVIGISIENSSGQVLVGTNTKILGIDTSLINGESKISFNLPNIFNTGRYKVSIAVHSPDGVTVYDWWNESATFNTHNPNTTPYLIAPHCKVDIR
jgi:ABC-2 type transport system ATP-binding protein